MKPFLYSNDINHLDFWKKILEHEACAIIQDEASLLDLRNQLIVLDYGATTKGFIKLLSAHNLVLVLDSTPNLSKAKKSFAEGARGYGNVLMSKVYMYAAIETLKGGDVWLIPSLTKSLIQSTEFPSAEGNHELLLAPLSVAQKEVALLLREGLGNKEIAQHQNVSINTIKSQIKSIYAKLGVNDKIAFILLFK